uniref:hypothetical protein n=1 Tax=Siminovitchia fortis TaxID=254758 RepID=UPI001C9306E6
WNDMFEGGKMLQVEGDCGEFMENVGVKMEIIGEWLGERVWVDNFMDGLLMGIGGVRDFDWLWNWMEEDMG